MRTIRASGALILAAVLAGSLPAQTGPARHHEQNSFSAEDEGVNNPVPVPDDVLSLLAAEDLVKTSMEDADPAMKVPPQSWFSASVIHLGPPEEADLIIQARGPLVGANIDTFWIVLRTSAGSRLVLTAGAHDLRVLKTRWKKYRSIQLFSATAVECTTTVLRYNGTKYEAYRSKSGPIPHC